MEPNWKSQFVTKEQMEQALEEMETKTTWGRWTLDKEVFPGLDICPYQGNNAKYEVPLFQAGCDFPIFTAWLGHWHNTCKRRVGVHTRTCGILWMPRRTSFGGVGNE